MLRPKEQPERDRWSARSFDGAHASHGVPAGGPRKVARGSFDKTHPIAPASSIRRELPTRRPDVPACGHVDSHVERRDVGVDVRASATLACAPSSFSQRHELRKPARKQRHAASSGTRRRDGGPSHICLELAAGGDGHTKRNAQDRSASIGPGRLCTQLATGRSQARHVDGGALDGVAARIQPDFIHRTRRGVAPAQPTRPVEMSCCGIRGDDQRVAATSRGRES